MASIKLLVSLAFSAAVGVTLIILACTARSDYNWWPLFSLVFYFLAPIPWMISSRFSEEYSGPSVGRELSIFFISGIVASAFGLPSVLSHASTISLGQAAFVWCANIVVFVSILLFFLLVYGQDSYGSPF